MKLEHLILGLLCLKPRTGYDIKKYFDTEGHFFRESVHFSQLYRTLKSMQEQGWTTFVGEEREGKPDTKTYFITPTGQGEFLRWLYSPLNPPFRFIESELPSRLLFSPLLNKKTILHFLQVELEFRQNQIVQSRNRDRHSLASSKLNKNIDPWRYVYFLDLLHEYGAGAVDYYIAWLKSTIARVEKEVSDDDNHFDFEQALAVYPAQNTSGGNIEGKII